MLTILSSNDCLCGSHNSYQLCCELLHLGNAIAVDATQLMRSRYTAYALQNIDYLVKTTLPAQQKYLDVADLAKYAKEHYWQKLNVLKHEILDNNHQAVSFEASFTVKTDMTQEQLNHLERSIFVKTNNNLWYFIHPTLGFPQRNDDCFCGAQKKFKKCCGFYL